LEPNKDAFGMYLLSVYVRQIFLFDVVYSTTGIFFIPHILGIK